MSLFQVVVITYFLCLLMSLSLAKYFDKCITPIGEQGNCVPVKSCASALYILRKILRYGEGNFNNEIQHLRKSQCDDVLDEKPHICCPEKDVQMNPAIYNYLKNLNCGSSGLPNIANGNKADLLAYRWMVLLKYDYKEPFLCQGSLLDEIHVLTAAHCVKNRDIMPYEVRLGEYDLNNKIDCVKTRKLKTCLAEVQDIRIEKIFVHESFRWYANGTYHDLALLRLKRPVNITTRNIYPICLPLSDKLQSHLPENFTIAGWGLTAPRKRSNFLLYTSVPNFPQKSCEKVLNYDLLNSQFCAGGTNLKDVCDLDSGGPIFNPHSYVGDGVREIQFGITSFGQSVCGAKNLPAVYTNVSHYMQWITDHMKTKDDYYYPTSLITDLMMTEDDYYYPTPRTEAVKSAVNYLKSNSLLFLLFIIDFLFL